MADLLSAFTTLFTFLIAQLGSIGTFFVSSVIGQLILGVALFSLLVYIVAYFIDKIRG